MKSGLICRHPYVLFLLIFLLSSNLICQVSNSDIYSRRRELLMNKMGEGIAVLEGSQTSTRNGDVDYKFRQNSDFYYLTGFDEPNASLILLPGKEKKFILFVSEVSPVMEVWIGKKSSIKTVMEFFGADTAYPVSAFDQILAKYLKGEKNIYINFADRDLKKKIDATREMEVNLNGDKEFDSHRQYSKLNLLIAEMRIIKDDEEISLIKNACNITAEAYKELLRIAKPGMYEYQLEAILDYIYKKDGAGYHAFPPIIASGKNALTLHYEDNKDKINDRDLVLIDVGAEYKNYAADLSRTFPINGNFSDEQKQIYEIVLKAGKKGISLAQKGIGFNELQDSVSAVVSHGLFTLGLITDELSNWQLNVWLPHGVSHMLGLETHDVGDVKYFDPRGRILEPGMVFTIEPGIYINPQFFDNVGVLLKNVSKEEINNFISTVKPVFEKYKGIGIRIEDDVLITNNGNEVLTRNAPKEIEDVLGIMKEEGKFIKQQIY